MSGKAEIPDNPTPKQKRRGWPKGVSGNPSGCQTGSRRKATLLAEQLLDGQAKDIVNKTVELALAGDVTALRVCMDRIVPPRKDRPVTFNLPPLKSLTDAGPAMACITAAAAAGELTPMEAADFSRLIEVHVKTLEATDIEQRIRALEASNAKS